MNVAVLFYPAKVERRYGNYTLLTKAYTCPARAARPIAYTGSLFKIIRAATPPRIFFI